MRLEYPAPFAVGDSTIIPMGPSPLAASSQVTKSTPLLAYACEARIFGTSVDNQASPCFTSSLNGAQATCMSLQTFGVMKLYRATVSLPRSVANFEEGST